MFAEKLSYFHGDKECIGFIAYDDQVKTRRPCILIAHAWRGQDDFARQKALEMAQHGAIAFAVDMYGEGLCTQDNEEAPKLMAPFYLDRELLQKRVQAAFHFMSEHPLVDPNKIGAMGFCFGGLVVYELLRSGVGLNAAVTFHGVFSQTDAKTVPISKEASGHLLVLHGHQDPLVTDGDLKRVQEEMTAAGIDWQIHIYGGAMHAFTNPNANNIEAGTVYHPQSEKRAFRSMQLFFEDLL